MIKRVAHPDQYPFLSYGLHKDEDISSCEMTYSALYSSALTRLIPLESGAEITHQGPVRKKPRTSGNPETADLLGYRISDKRPAQNVFVSDLKKQISP